MHTPHLTLDEFGNRALNRICWLYNSSWHTNAIDIVYITVIQNTISQMGWKFSSFGTVLNIRSRYLFILIKLIKVHIIMEVDTAECNKFEILWDGISANRIKKKRHKSMTFISSTVICKYIASILNLFIVCVNCFRWHYTIENGNIDMESGGDVLLFRLCQKRSKF